MALILSSLEKAEVCGAERRSEAEETIYNRGDPDQPLYFLVKGVVKLYKSKGDTRRFTFTGACQCFRQWAF
jgi:CRP-like cAMP-binding protein